MKTNLLLLCITSILLFSCQNEEALFVNVTKETSSTRSLDKIDHPYYVDEDGALHFKSANDYFALSDSLLALSDSAYKKWEREIGFESYRSIIDDILSSTESDEALLERYDQYIYRNEEGLICPREDFRVYQNVMNRDGIFYVKGIKHTVKHNTINTYDTQNNRSMPSISLLGEAIPNQLVEYPMIHSEVFGNKKIMTGFKIYQNAVSEGTINAGSLLFEVTVRPRNWNSLIGFTDCDDICIVEEATIHMEGLGFCNYTDEEGNILHDKLDQWNDLTTHRSSSKTRLYTLTYIIYNKGNFGIVPSVKDPICVHYRARIEDMG